MYVRIQELVTDETTRERISYHREVKRLSNLIRDIEFSYIAGNETGGKYRYDPSSVDHVIGERQGHVMG